MESVSILACTNVVNVGFRVDEVVYVPRNGSLCMKESIVNKMLLQASWHGVVLYLPERRSHLVPVAMIKTDKEQPSKGFAEIKANGHMFFRTMRWMDKQPSYIVVPAADCVERYLRAEVMTAPGWENTSYEGRLMQFERVLNQLDLLGYCYHKREVENVSTLSPDALWWDALKLRMPDGTVLEITASGPISVHIESESTTNSKVGGAEIEDIWVPSVMHAGHA